MVPPVLYADVGDGDENDGIEGAIFLEPGYRKATIPSVESA
jgi:hypothetical protein